MQEPSLLIDAWPVTSQGQVRPNNEDFVAVYEPDDPQMLALSGNLYVVADGVGGSAAGEVASRYAANKIIYEFYKSTNIDLGARLRKAIQEANGDLYRYAEGNPNINKTSTTIVAVAVRGEQYHIASVGDSRVYLVRAGKATQLTRDHTLVAELVEQGSITPEEAKEHPQRNVILRNLGSQTSVEVDLFDGRLESDDRMVLCSDGLTRYVDGDELAESVTAIQPTVAAERLVSLANERGGRDNITAFVLNARTGIPTPRTPLPFAWDGHEPYLRVEHKMAIPPAPDTEPRPTIEPPTQPIPAAEQPTQPLSPPLEHPTQPIPRPAVPAAQPPAPAPPPATETSVPTPPPPPSPQPPPFDPYAQPAAPVAEQRAQGGQPRTYRPPDASGRPIRGGGGNRGILIGLVAVVILTIAGVVAVTTLLPLLNLGSNRPAAQETPEQDSGLPVVVLTAPPGQETPLPTTIADPGAAGAVPSQPTQQTTPPGMVLVEVGEFIRGADDDEVTLAIRHCIQEGGGACPIELFDDATPQQIVTLGGFFIDRSEVTNAQYTLCVAAAACDPPLDTLRYDDAAYTNHPVTNVTWSQSASYCVWADKRLPTEAEWEKAARGIEGRIWPWGSTWEPGRSNTIAAQLNGTSTVESFSNDVSSYGVIGMAGNASEWVADWYQADYQNLASIDPQGPLAQPSDEPIKVARGGSYRSLSAYARGAHRLEVNSGSAVGWLGFRCAASQIGATVAPAQPDAEAATPDATTPEATIVPSPTP